MSEWHNSDAVSTVNLNQKCALTADVNQVISGIKTFSYFPVGPSSLPVNMYEFANKKYVDDFGGGGGGVPLDIQGWGFSGTFSATDYNTVAWSGGTLRFSKGTSYVILAGNTGNIVAPTYIYFDYNVSQTTLQLSTDPADVTGVGKVLIAVANDNPDTAKKAEFQAFGGRGGIQTIVTTDMLAAQVITANELAVNSVYAGAIQTGIVSLTHLDFVPLSSSGTTGQIVATINASAEDGSLKINASRINITGSVTFAAGYDPTTKYALSGNTSDDIVAGTTTTTMLKSWRHASDVTKIDGGVIYTGTVVLGALAFIPLSSSGTTGQIIATINASGEDGALKITAARINISGSTTFEAGYNPTEKATPTDVTNATTPKLDKVGGIYTSSAAAVAKVQIFPNAQTALLVTDGTKNVFAAYVGTTGAFTSGDVVIGDISGKYLKWDNSDGALQMVMGSTNIYSEFVGDSSSNYLKFWDKTNVSTTIPCIHIGPNAYSQAAVGILGRPTASIGGYTWVTGQDIKMYTYKHSTSEYLGGVEFNFYPNATNGDEYLRIWSYALPINFVCAVGTIGIHADKAIKTDTSFYAGTTGAELNINTLSFHEYGGTSQVVSAFGNGAVRLTIRSDAGVDKLYIYGATGNISTAGSLYFAGALYQGASSQQVVGARGAAVADATDAASAITQLNALLARIRAHGLIAT